MLCERAILPGAQLSKKQVSSPVSGSVGQITYSLLKVKCPSSPALMEQIKRERRVLGFSLSCPIACLTVRAAAQLSPFHPVKIDPGLIAILVRPISGSDALHSGLHQTNGPQTVSLYMLEV